MDLISTLFITILASFAINMVMFLVAFRYKTDKLTDISYAISFVTLAGFAVASSPQFPAPKLVLFGLIAIWAARLGTFLLVRIWKKKVDHRFDGMREDFRRFAGFWALQALSVWVILLPILLALSHTKISLTALSYIGIALWAIGVAIESIADIQKYNFSQDPANKGTWIDTGIWRYSRHPNYFGEILAWIGAYVCVLPILTTLESWIGLISPVFITCLLLFVSGIPPLEKHADEKWGSDPEYQAYKRRTSILIPWRKNA